MTLGTNKGPGVKGHVGLKMKLSQTIILALNVAEVIDFYLTRKETTV